MFGDPWDEYLSRRVAGATTRFIVVDDADGDPGVWDVQLRQWVDTNGDIYDADGTYRFCAYLNEENAQAAAGAREEPRP